MLIYILLVITIIVSCMTCLITIFLEKNEIEIQQINSEEELNKTSANLLSKTVDITKTIEILDISDDSSEDYSQEPVIIAVLDEDTIATK